MMKQSKKFIAIMLTFVFVLSLVPFSASAETITADITGGNKLAGYTRGSTNKDTVFRNWKDDYPQQIMKTGTGTNAYKTFLQYNMNDYIEYLDGADTSVSFSIQHSDYTGRQTRSYDLYILKGDHVDLSGDSPEPLISMQYLKDLGVIDDTTNCALDVNHESLIKVYSFNVEKIDAGLQTYEIEGLEDRIKEALGDTGWVTFILNGTFTDTSKMSQVKGNDAGTKLTITYDPDQAAGDDDALASIDTHELTVDKANGTATANISVTNGTGEDVTYNLYIVVYNDGEMSKIVADTLTVTAGNEGSKEFSCAEEITTGSKVKFLVWEADGITPAIASIEK